MAAALPKSRSQISGTSVDDIDRAEDQGTVRRCVDTGRESRARKARHQRGGRPGAAGIGYLMVRPSYVLGGRAMEIVYNGEELRDYERAWK